MTSTIHCHTLVSHPDARWLQVGICNRPTPRELSDNPESNENGHLRAVNCCKLSHGGCGVFRGEIKVGVCSRPQGSGLIFILTTGIFLSGGPGGIAPLEF